MGMVYGSVDQLPFTLACAQADEKENVNAITARSEQTGAVRTKRRIAIPPYAKSGPFGGLQNARTKSGTQEFEVAATTLEKSVDERALSSARLAAMSMCKPFHIPTARSCAAALRRCRLRPICSASRSGGYDSVPTLHESNGCSLNLAKFTAVRGTANLSANLTANFF